MTVTIIRGQENALVVARQIVKSEGISIRPEALENIAAIITDRIESGGPDGASYIQLDGSKVDLRKFVVGAAIDAGAGIMTGTQKDVVSFGNPFAKKSWNLTKQHMMERDSPDRAAMLKAHAVKADAAEALSTGDPNNPWSRAGFNLTEQMRLERTDPERAAHLAAQEGVTL